MNPNLVALARAESAAYPETRPFHPGESYPEYPFPGISPEPNHAYAAVRESLRLLGLDAEHYGTPEWNPLGEVVRPGDRVLLKPNMVRETPDRGGEWPPMVTHGSVIRALLDYVYIALKGRGEITVADAPVGAGDFDRVADRTGIADVCRFFSRDVGFPVGLHDLRVEQAILRDGLVVERRRLEGDPRGYREVALGRWSAFHGSGHDPLKLRGADYDVEETIEHHSGERQEYLLSGSVLDADVFINVPKLKTHRRAGVTLCLKNLIGINGDKNWIPHYRIGGPRRGGDEFPSPSLIRHIESQAMDRFKQAVFRAGPLGRYVASKARKIQKGIVEHTGMSSIRGGGWYGNDTLWRSIVDLNRICLHADREGRMHESLQRRYLVFLDGIVAGQGNGPFANTAVPLGAVVAGIDPVSVDIAAIDLMGYDYRRIPKVMRALEDHVWPITSCSPPALEYRSNFPGWESPLREGLTETARFQVPRGWEGRIERETPVPV